MSPPLPPTRPGFDLSPAGSPIVVELFLDLICPYSARMFATLHASVLGQFGDRVSFVLHQVPQPWHPQGSYLHEAALCVRAACPAKYAAFFLSVCAAFDQFSDAATLDQSRAQIYAEILRLAAETLSEPEVAQVKSMLGLAGAGNSGNQATQLMKWAVKHHRTRGVHVTPTVFVNGLEAGIVSSGWTGEHWVQWLAPLGADGWQGSLL